MTDTETKTCSKCKVEKDLDQFTVDRSRADGLRIYCVQCARKAVRTSVQRYPDRAKARARKENRVRYRALKRLRHAHVDEYQRYVDEERALYEEAEDETI